MAMNERPVRVGCAVTWAPRLGAAVARRARRLRAGRNACRGEKHQRAGGERGRPHCTPTAVHACTTAASTLLPGYNSRAAWMVAARAMEKVAFDGSMKTNPR